MSFVFPNTAKPFYLASPLTFSLYGRVGKSDRRYMILQNKPVLAKRLCVYPDLCYSVVPTNVGTFFSNYSAMLDGDDNTNFTVSISATITEDTNYLQWDFGDVSDRIIYFRFNAGLNSSTFGAKVKVSNNGSTWTTVINAVSVGSPTNYFYRGNFRYLRITPVAGTTGYSMYFYTLECYNAGEPIYESFSFQKDNGTFMVVIDDGQYGFCYLSEVGI